MIQNIAGLVEEASSRNCKISELMIEHEIENTGKTREEIVAQMTRNLHVMADAVDQGFKGVKSFSGLTGGDAVLLKNYIDKGNTLSGESVMEAVAAAISTNEVNAAMGKICANPTAGSAGTVPGVLFAVKNSLNPTEDEMVNFLFTAGAFGIVVANNASISGAAGGCQAEVGTAAAMASAAAVEMAGGTPEQCANAFAITMKNMLGLVCDPVAGLVEVPCVKRNAGGAANAMVAADMALAGVHSKIPCDEVIDAMHRIGQTMPSALRETALGGLATTATGLKYEEQIFGKK